MDKDVTQVLPDDPEKLTDRTIVIPAEELGGKGAAAVSDNGGAAPNADTAVRRSILSDLGNFIFPRRSVADETIELICAGPETAASAAVAPKEAAELEDVTHLYDIEEKPIAAGGQGRISRAIDRALGCEVAVKSLHEKFCGDEHARGNFLNEAKLTAALDHPAVIPIHGLFGDPKHGMHLAMKLISGHTLSEYLKQIVTLYEKKGIRRFDEHKSLRNRIEIFLKVCEALEYAHDRGIIHRDLKLENIMIGRHRETYVTDWGLAMRIEDAAALKKVDGTPGYIAPEVLLTRRADARSDVYSLGIMLFELVTLTPAFTNPDLPTLLSEVKQGRHAPLRHRFKCRIDADLKAIIRKAIAVDPAKRYQKVAELSEDMRRFLTNEETIARPDHFFGKICRWSVNHRRGMLLATLAVLLLGAAGIARTLYKEMLWSTERRLRDNAIGSVYSAVTSTANKLEKDMERIEYLLEQFRMNLLFSGLKLDVPNQSGAELFVPIGEYDSNPPARFAYSDSYRHKIDPDGACVFNWRGGEVDPAELKYFGNTAQFMREALLETEKYGEDAARERLFRQGRSIKKIYFLLADGTFSCYPGSKDDFPPGYAPPERIWYQRAEKAGGRRIWSGPYRDSGVHGESVITCSTAIYGADRKFIGMAAIDFSLTRLAEKMLNPEGEFTRFTYSKMLIDPEGEVIFRMVPPERRGGAVFHDAALIREMLRMRNGTLLTKHHGKEHLLAFAYLDSIDVLYVACLDLDALVGERRRAERP